MSVGANPTPGLPSTCTQYWVLAATPSKRQLEEKQAEAGSCYLALFTHLAATSFLSGGGVLHVVSISPFCPFESLICQNWMDWGNRVVGCVVVGL